MAKLLLNVWSGTAPIFTTGKLRWEQLSAPARLDPGSYTLVDWKIPFLFGEITIGEEQSEGTLLVGAFFLPAVLLASYRTLFAANGFRIESEHMFTHERRNEVLVIFSTEEAGRRWRSPVRLTAAAARLCAMNG